MIKYNKTDNIVPEPVKYSIINLCNGNIKDGIYTSSKSGWRDILVIHNIPFYIGGSHPIKVDPNGNNPCEYIYAGSAQITLIPD